MTTPFLLSSWTELPGAPVLDGFAFDGADAVIGSAGLAGFEAARGRPLRPGGDGVHILCRPEAQGVAISADAAGYRHLFYWRGDAGAAAGRWAVGESFVDLVAHLRARGVALAENRAQTGAFLSRKQAFQQLTTRETAVAGIEVLLPGERLLLRDGALAVGPVPSAPAADYPAALRDFLETWLGRCRTLAGDADLQLWFHLSGGVDSRAVTAFFLWLRRHGELADRATLRSLTDAAHADDLAVAERVAAATGLPLNHLAPRPGRPLDAAESRALWQAHSAGAYSPVRLMRETADPRDLHFTGHGGGGYKADLDARGVDRALARMARAYGYFGRGDRRAWRAALEDMLAALAEDRGTAWTRLQRVSRARFHGGQAATYKTQIALLDSQLAARAADARPAGSWRGTQFHFDIMASLAPDLLDLPFDDPRKAPDAGQRAALTCVAGLAPQAGRIFGRFPGPEPAVAADAAAAAAALPELLAEVEAGWAALPRRRVNWLFRWHVRRLARAIRAGRRPDPVALRHLHTAWLLIRLAGLGLRFDR
ncbi:asparagine synthase-related protein [Roseivivax sp. CAU 1761]